MSGHSNKTIRLAVLISGRGSNLQALIDACKSPDFPAEISLVISNTPGAYGLERARKANISHVTIPHKAFENRESFEDAMIHALNAYDVDLICLAGFMRVLSSHFITAFPQKIINIHPSLLPDYKGLNTHERVLADGGTKTGCTVHYVVPELDSGPVVLQKSVNVHKDDTPETLAARVLEQEHIAYPEAVIGIAKDLHKQTNLD